MPADIMPGRLPSASEPESIRLGRKTILLALVMIASALGLLFLFRTVKHSAPFLPHVLSAACMGLAAGLSTRWVMQKQTSVLRIVSSMAFIIGGLELLGWFTGWQIGFGPLKVGLSSVDWYSLGQFLLGTGIALLAMAAWSAPAGSLPRSVPAQRTSRATAQPRPPAGRRRANPQRTRRGTCSSGGKSRAC